MTDAGFGPTAIVVDETTGCHLWQGCMLYRQPHARLKGQTVRPRVLAFARAKGPVPAGHKLRPTCQRWRCINPEHQEPYVPGQKPKRPHQRSGRKSSLQQQIKKILPAQRPPDFSQREWAALVGVAAGNTLAAVGQELGISRQRVHQLVAHGQRKLVGEIDRPAVARAQVHRSST